MMGFGERAYGLAEWHSQRQVVPHTFLAFHEALALWPLNFRIRERMAALMSATEGLDPRLVRGVVDFAIRHDPYSPTLLVYAIVSAFNRDDREAADAALVRLEMVAVDEEGRFALNELRRVRDEVWPPAVDR